MKAGRYEIQGHPWLHDKFEASLVYVRLYLKKKFPYIHLPAYPSFNLQYIHTYTHIYTHIHTLVWPSTQQPFLPPDHEYSYSCVCMCQSVYLSSVYPPMSTAMHHSPMSMSSHHLPGYLSILPCIYPSFPYASIHISTHPSFNRLSHQHLLCTVGETI